MKRVIILTLTLSLIILSGCSKAKTSEAGKLDKGGKPSNSAQSSATNTTSANSKQGTSTTNGSGDSKKAPELNSKQKQEVKNKVSNVVSSVDGVIKSIEEAQEINLN